MHERENEMLEVVDEEGRPIRLALRSELHGNPELLHRVVHVLVFNAVGKLLLQKRSMSKDVAPGKWDTSVGGHVNPGEQTIEAAAREMNEELGIRGTALSFLHRYIFSNRTESELVYTYTCVWDGAVEFEREEIDAVAFWDLEEIIAKMGTGLFSRHFEKEFAVYLGRNTKASES